MRIEKAKIENFRLLEAIEISFESTATVIVGRNNSGKTSLTEVFDRFMGERPTAFRLEDFSAGARGKFLAARALRLAGGSPEAVLAMLPKISLTLTVSYDPAAPDLGPLSLFIIDLDTGCTTANVSVEYAPTLRTLQALFDVPSLEGDGDDTAHFYKGLRETLPKAYSAQLSAIDPTDAANTRRFDSMAPLAALVQCGFVRAQRTLDHSKSGDTDVIGKLLGTLFQTAASDTAAAADQALAAALKTSVDGVQSQIQGDFNEKLKDLLPALGTFGFPSLNDTTLRPETALDVESLLSDHTRIFYEGSHGVHLPEGYNGLGTRNLIYILLQLASFHKAYRARPVTPGAHLIFIEEPEAHLHPQMQEVFISQLGAAIGALSAAYPDEPIWRAQFVVSTHSSHLANAATFEAIRYFLTKPVDDPTKRQTTVKDFRKSLTAIDPNDRDFLHQYMTLTKCDLYFADKAVVVEGTTERVLMPRIYRIVDEGLSAEAKLARQYLTIVEVGGAHAHVFYPLFDFLELKTLVITDIDAVRLDTDKQPPKWVKCPHADGARTSNAAIKSWFGVEAGVQLSLADLAAKTDAEKVQGFRRIAYQLPEEGSAHCARSYEDALILANPEEFGIAPGANMAAEAWDAAQDLSKTDTALRFAIEVQQWVVPKYIRDGLVWLSEPPPPPAEPPAIEEAI